MWTNPAGMLHLSPAHRRTPTTLTTNPIMVHPLVNSNGHSHIPIHFKVSLGSISNLATARNPDMAHNLDMATILGNNAVIAWDIFILLWVLCNIV